MTRFQSLAQDASESDGVDAGFNGRGGIRGRSRGRIGFLRRRGAAYCKSIVVFHAASFVVPYRDRENQINLPSIDPCLRCCHCIRPIWSGQMPAITLHAAHWDIAVVCDISWVCRKRFSLFFGCEPRSQGSVRSSASFGECLGELSHCDLPSAQRARSPHDDASTTLLRVVRRSYRRAFYE